MLTLKKLIFAPLFLIVFILLIYQLSPVFKSYDFIFSLSLDTLVQLVTICILIALSSFLFTLFAAFSLDWKFVLPVGILASFSPLLFLDQATGIILAGGIFISFILSFVSLENTMKSYLTFQPTALLGPSIRHLSGLLILVFAIAYFLAINKIVVQKGFEIPDALIDTALKFSQPQSAQQDSTPQLAIPKEQLDLLRKNPDLLKQAGLDPKILDSLGQASQKAIQAPNDLIKQTVKDQIQGFIKPYLGYVPVILALLLFLTLQSLTAIINLFIYPLLWIVFFILEKSGFVKFELEQRPVKKIVV